MEFYSVNFFQTSNAIKIEGSGIIYVQKMCREMTTSFNMDEKKIGRP
jgi:hypothetical protein